MLGRLATFLVVAFAGILAMAGTAGAIPSYPPSGGPAVAVTAVSVDVGGTTEFFGTGFLAGETIDIYVTMGGPTGLHRSAAPTLRDSSFSTTTVAAGDGSFAIDIVLDESGLATLTATGRSSGRTGTVTVQVGPTDSEVANVNGSEGGVDSPSDADGLASTGASLVGPIAIGLIALLAGFTLLFFGTRGAMRRKVPRPGG